MESKKIVEILKEFRQAIIYIIVVAISSHIVTNRLLFVIFSVMYGVVVLVEILREHISSWHKRRRQFREDRQKIAKIYEFCEKMMSLQLLSSGFEGSLGYYVDTLPGGLYQKYFSRILDELELEVRTLLALSKYFTKHRPKFDKDVNVVDVLERTLHHLVKKFEELAREFESASKDAMKWKSKCKHFRLFIENYKALVGTYRELFGEVYYYVPGNPIC